MHPMSPRLPPAVLTRPCLRPAAASSAGKAWGEVDASGASAGSKALSWAGEGGSSAVGAQQASAAQLLKNLAFEGQGFIRRAA